MRKIPGLSQRRCRWVPAGRCPDLPEALPLDSAGRCPNLPEALPLDSAKGAKPPLETHLIPFSGGVRGRTSGGPLKVCAVFQQTVDLLPVLAAKALERIQIEQPG